MLLCLLHVGYKIVTMVVVVTKTLAQFFRLRIVEGAVPSRALNIPRGVETKFSDEVSWAVPRSKLGCDALISRVIACVLLIWAREGLPNEFYGTGWQSIEHSGFLFLQYRIKISRVACVYVLIHVHTPAHHTAVFRTTRHYPIPPREGNLAEN